MTGVPQAHENEQLLRAVVDAYYPNALKEGEAARNRAQVAFTITSAIVASLVAGGVFVDIGTRPLVPKALGVAALGCWFVAAFLFLHAVASPVAPVHTGTVPSDQFVTGVLENIRSERDTVQERQQSAFVASTWALTLTFATVLALLASHSEREFSGTLARMRLSSDAIAGLPARCVTGSHAVTGLVDPDRLDGSFVEMRGVACAGRTLTLLIAEGDVQTIAFDTTGG